MNWCSNWSTSPESKPPPTAAALEYQNSAHLLPSQATRNCCAARSRTSSATPSAIPRANRPSKSPWPGETAAALVDVRDHGPGVPEEALARLFDAFYRVETDRNRTSGGIGLGLSIARRAIELHKGIMRARNAQPGLEVEMELPVSRPPADLAH